MAVSIIAEAIGLSHVRYRLTKLEGAICSMQDFVDTNTEFVAAYQVARSGIWDPEVSLYDHLISRCSANGFDVVPFLDCMMIFDYIIGNTDRHVNNFEIVRNTDTLEWLHPAPLFDKDTIMDCDLLTVDIMSGVGMDCALFSEY